MFPKIMKNYVNNKTVYKYVDFHSDATTHKEIDDGRKDSQQELIEQHNLAIEYALVCLGMHHLKDSLMEKCEPSWQRLGSLSQKIGAEMQGSNGLAVDI